MKFFEYQNRLGVIAIEPDAIAATVIGNATDILYLMLPKNTPCLAGAGGTEQIVNFQFPELLGKRFAFQIIPQWSIFCVWRQKAGFSSTISAVERPSFTFRSSWCILGEFSSPLVGGVPNSTKVPTTQVSAFAVSVHLPSFQI